MFLPFIAVFYHSSWDRHGNRQNSIEIYVKITMCGDKTEEKIISIKIWCG